MAVAWGPCLADEVVKLKFSDTLTLKPASTGSRDSPVFVDADSLTGLQGETVVAEGNVIARTLGDAFRADWLQYDPRLDEIRARGNVRLQQDNTVLECSDVRLRLSDHVGEMNAARFTLPSDSGPVGRGGARRVLFEGRDRYRLEQAAYTTCPAGNDDWQLKTEELGLDYVKKVGLARDVKVEYQGIPILYAPWLDFSLDRSRKTGFLSPSFGLSDDRGLEIITPWYWNIAANRDATVLPRLMTRRGLQIGGEFRYLEPNYRGEAMFEALPVDNVYHEGRYRGYIDHQHRFSPRLSGRLLFEQVSDDTYFTDLATLVSQTSRAILPSEALLTYAGEGWTATGRLQTYQTLQDPAAPISEPYERLPQLTMNADRRHLFGGPMRFTLSSELVRFEHDDPAKPVGNRIYAYPALEAHYERTYGFIRPKLGWHLSAYDLDRNPDHPDSTSATRSLPIFSLDSGAYLEREWQLAGVPMLQTLEPRLYYVNIPNRDQSRLPVFDSSLADFFQAQLFAENQFIGVDRINDANQITLAVTSRLLEPNTGLERLQVTLGQRYYFNDQQVSMPGYAVRGANVTDLLAQVSGQLTDRWRVDSGFQYNPDDGELVRANFGATYRAGPGRLNNADLRYINENYGAGLNQLDLSWQWPIKPGWYGLGRINYSFYDSRLVEGLLGFEHNAGCWSLRGVMQKLATTANQSSQAFYLQLELHGLTQLGPNPLEVLKRSITGYTKSDEFDPMP
ncbi:MAG: LPS-assembly protein LptD [Pseudomonadota bacterium]